MLKESMDHARDDMDARNLREQQVEAERVIEALEVALAADGDALLSAEERAGLEQGMDTLREVKQGNDEKAIKKAIDALNSKSTEFAARRMNASIQQALSGQDLDKFE
jgi:molecular chaperone HscA